MTPEFKNDSLGDALAKKLGSSSPSKKDKSSTWDDLAESLGIPKENREKTKVLLQEFIHELKEK